MKISISKEWFATRAASEEGKSIEAGSLHGAGSALEAARLLRAKAERRKRSAVQWAEWGAMHMAALNFEWADKLEAEAVELEAETTPNDASERQRGGNGDA